MDEESGEYEEESGEYEDEDGEDESEQEDQIRSKRFDKQAILDGSESEIEDDLDSDNISEGSNNIHIKNFE